MKKKKQLSALLAAVMMITLIPASVFAQDTVPENTYTDISAYTQDAGSGKLDGKDVYVTIKDKKFTEADGFVVANTQTKANPPRLHLTIQDCTFEGNTAKDNANPSFMYLSNCKELVIDRCTFTAGTNQKYGINWNLIGVQDATVEIKDSTFKGDYSSNAVKLTQRGGEGDSKGKNETFAGKAGTIASVVISGCSFDENAKVAFGTQTKEVAFDGGVIDTGVANVNSGSFPISLSDNKTAVVVSEQYLANKAGDPVETTVPKGTTVEKAADTAIAGSEAFPFTDIDDYSAAVKMHGLDGKDVYVDIQDQKFSAENGTHFVVANVQSYQKPPKLHLSLTNCEFVGNTANDSSNSSFMYLPNCQSLDIEGCTFTAGADQKYGINWNLIGIKDSTVSVKNSTFTGPFEKNALKLNQRNGEDDKATDVKNGNTEAASIKSAVIEGCTFNDAVVSLGSQGKGENGAKSPSTGAFPVVIQNNKTPVVVEQAYSVADDVEEIPSITLETGKVLVKTADEEEVHTPVKTEAKKPTATEPGNIEYWYCPICKKYYKDAALTQETSLEGTVLPATGEEPSGPSDTEDTGKPTGTPTTAPSEEPDDTTPSQTGPSDTEKPGEPTGAPTTVVNEEPDDATSPHTGYNSNLGLCLLLLLASGSLAGAAFVAKKRKAQ